MILLYERYLVRFFCKFPPNSNVNTNDVRKEPSCPTHACFRTLEDCPLCWCLYCLHHLLSRVQTYQSINYAILDYDCFCLCDNNSQIGMYRFIIPRSTCAFHGIFALLFALPLRTLTSASYLHVSLSRMMLTPFHQLDAHPVNLGTPGSSVGHRGSYNDQIAILGEHVIVDLSWCLVTRTRLSQRLSIGYKWPLTWYYHGLFQCEPTVSTPFSMNDWSFQMVNLYLPESRVGYSSVSYNSDESFVICLHESEN